MLLDGTIKYIDELRVEFHNIKVDIPGQRNKELIAQIEGLGIPVSGALSDNQGDWFEE